MRRHVDGLGAFRLTVNTQHAPPRYCGNGACPFYGLDS